MEDHANAASQEQTQAHYGSKGNGYQKRLDKRNAEFSICEATCQVGTSWVAKYRYRFGDRTGTPKIQIDVLRIQTLCREERQNRVIHFGDDRCVMVGD
jgi:hypothetical protein